MTQASRRSPSRASPAPIRTSPAARPIRTASRCPARPSRTPSRRSPNGDADLGMIPIENSVAGRVADIHHLMPTLGPAHHRRMVPADPPSVDGAEGRHARRTSRRSQSHVHALGQCRNIIRKLRHQGDRRGRHRRLRAARSPSAATRPRAAIASRLAAEIYGLDILAEDVEDETHNTTRFVVLAREPNWAEAGQRPGGHHLRLPGAQPAGRALQGDGRLRHQRRQHDQAGKLHGRRRLLRRRSSMPTSRAIRTTRR